MKRPPSFAVLALVVLVPVPRAQGNFVPCTHVLHTFEGEAVGDWFGFVSAPIPDGNGDGVAEILIGAPLHDLPGSNAGRIYVYDGRTGVELFHADGGIHGERLGFAVREAGDIDGDGVCDVLAGGPGSATVAGAARVFSGASGAPLLTLQLGAAGDLFGHSVCGIGDVDGDGTPDLAVGAIQDDSAGTNAGRVVVVSGADGVTVLRSLTGEQPGDGFGSALGSLGDVTGDGRPELAVGAFNAGASGQGRAYVYDLATGLALYALDPDASGVDLGLYYIGSAGESDGDGFPDLYVADFGDRNGRGKAYVFSGVSGARLLTLSGDPGDGFGVGRPLGDLNGDGRTDLVLGSYTDDSGAANAGKVEVFSGADGSLLRRITSTSAQEQLGFDAHGLGDVDGDGVPEMLVTAANFDSKRGRAFVIAAAPLSAFGSGLAGSGALVPRLALSGCPRLGAPIAFEIADGLGGALASLVIGTRRIDLPFHGGTLYPDNLARLPHRLGGTPGLAGAGTSSLGFTLPNDPALLGVTFHSQALIADRGAPQGVALTAALSLTPYP
ncbi:MAG: hypothetical protein EXS08_13855 [Planctomycetes bacterium]|nr:hypothetical protein [Planctomycetota bacterium]